MVIVYCVLMRYDIALIKRQMAIAGLSQTELVRRIGKTPSWLSHLLKGNIKGSAPAVKALADALGLSMSDIILAESTDPR